MVKSYKNKLNRHIVIERLSLILTLNELNDIRENSKKR